MATAGDIPSVIHLRNPEGWLPPEAVGDPEDRALFGEKFISNIDRLKRNDPKYKELRVTCRRRSQELERPAWERLGTYVAANHHLRKMDLNGSELDDSKMAALFGTLTTSAAVWSEWRSMHGAILGKFPALTSIDFGHNGGIDSECLESLFDAMVGGNVEALDFTACNIDSLAVLGQYTLPNLRTLCLGDNSFTDIPLQALANYTHLKKLDLSQNEIGSRGFSAIANLLRGGSRLDQLHLTSTAMNDTDMANIADSLKCNRRLHTLNVGKNDFGPAGLVAFLKLLIDLSSIGATGNSNNTLRTMRFEPTGTSDEEAADDEPRQKFNEVASHVIDALRMNDRYGYRYGYWHSGRQKVITTLLDRRKLVELSRLQGIEPPTDHQLFSDIDPILLPDLVCSVTGPSPGTAIRCPSIWDRREFTKVYRITVVLAPDFVSLINRKALLKDAMANNEARRARNEETLAAIHAEQAVLAVANSRMEKELMSIEAEEAAACLSGNKRERDTP